MNTVDVGSWEEFKLFLNRSGWSWNNLLGQEGEQGFLKRLEIFTPQQFGAKGDASQDDTLAIQAAIDAAKTVGLTSFGANFASATRVYFPPGIYRVGSLDCTGCTGLDLYAVPGTVVLYGSEQTSSAAIIDFVGSSNCQVHGLIVAGSTTGGTDPSVIPNCGYLFAESDATPGDSNKNHMSCCGSLGKFTGAALGIVGSPDNKWDFCGLQNMTSSSPVIVISTQPDYGLSSIHLPIQNVAGNVGNQTFVECEAHARYLDTTGTAETIYMRDVDAVRFFGCNIDNSGPMHVRVQGTANTGISFYGTQFYSEAGHAADDLISIDSGTMTGLGLYNINTVHSGFTDDLIVGSGVLESAVLRGIPIADLTGELLYQCAEPGFTAGARGLGVAAASTTFIGPTGEDGVSENNVAFLAVRDGVFTCMQAITGGSPGVGQSYTFTLRINNADQALVATISGANITAEDITHSVGVTRGQRVAVKVQTSASSNALTATSVSVGFIPA